MLRKNPLNELAEVDEAVIPIHENYTRPAFMLSFDEKWMKSSFQ